MHDAQAERQRPVGGRGPAAVRPRHRPVDRRGRGGPARLGGAARVHARRRHGEPRAAPAAAGRPRARPSLSEPTWDRAARLRSRERSRSSRALVKGRHAPVAAWRLPSRTAPEGADGRTRDEPTTRGERLAPPERRSLVLDGARPAQDLRGRERAACGRCAGADLDAGRAASSSAIMGPSGCGKSTLLNLVAGLDRADEGEIVLAGEARHRSERGRAGPHAAPPHRDRVPVLQPARGHERAGERRAARR